MNEREQYEIFEKLMLKALKNPNEINNICIRVIISLATIASKTNEEFREITDFMNESFEETEDIEEIMAKVMLIQKIMES